MFQNMEKEYVQKTKLLAHKKRLMRRRNQTEEELMQTDDYSTLPYYYMAQEYVFSLVFSKNSIPNFLKYIQQKSVNFQKAFSAFFDGFHGV